VYASGVILRSTTESDEAELRALYAQTRADLAAMDALIDFQWRARSQSYAAMGARHFLVLLDGQTVGYVATAESDDANVLVDIAVALEHRRRGIAAAVIAQLIDEAARVRMPLRLTVARDNAAALALYYRLGFTVVGETELDLAMERLPTLS
jgi:ribosomal-protein-alanine N-acetyltransferase